MRPRLNVSLGLLTALLLALAPALPFGVGFTRATSAAQAGEGITGDTSYESPQYGYTVIWDDPWVLNDVDSDLDESDSLVLTGDDAELRLTGQAAADIEPAEVIETAIEARQDEEPETEVIADDLEADVPTAELTAGDNRVQIEARTVGDGDAIVLVELQAPDTAFEDALTAAEAVLLDDEPILTGEEETPSDETPAATEEPTDETPEATEEADESDMPSLELSDPTEEASDTDTDTDTDTDGGNGLTLEETPASDDEGASGVDGNTYTSPTYDFTFEWDEEVWQVSQEGEFDEPGIEGLQLESQIGLLTVVGLEGLGGDAELCLESEVEFNEEFEGVDDWELATDADGEELTGGDADSAYGVYTFTLADPADDAAAPIELVAYIECRTLVEDEAVLDIRAISPRELYNDHIDSVLAVTETIELAGVETQDDPTPEVDLDSDETPVADDETPTPPTPEDEETPESTPAGETSGVDGATFTSPTYDFSLAWPDGWEVVDETIDEAEATETLVLSNGVSTVTIEAITYEDDLPRCVDAAIDEDAEDSAYAGLELATTGDGEPFQGSDEDSAYAVYLYPGEDDEEFAHFVECRWIVEGESALVFTQDVPNDQWVDQRQERLDIQESITLAEE